MEDCGFFWVAVSSHWKRVCGDLLSLRYFCSFGGLSTACLFPVKSPWKVFSLVPQAVFFCAPKPLPSSSDLVVCTDESRIANTLSLSFTVYTLKNKGSKGCFVAMQWQKHWGSLKNLSVDSS